MFRAAYVDNSWGNVIRGYQFFCQFVKIYEQTHPEWDGKVTMNLYQDMALWLFQTRGIASKTIRTHISSANAVLNEKGWGLNMHNHATESLVRMMRGVDRIRKVYEIGRVLIPRRALIDAMLEIMLVIFDVNDALELAMSTCIIFGKQTGLRSHNYVYTQPGGFVRIRHLEFGYTRGKLSTLIVTLPYAKTHQIENQSYPVSDARNTDIALPLQRRILCGACGLAFNQT